MSNFSEVGKSLIEDCIEPGAPNWGKSRDISGISLCFLKGLMAPGTNALASQKYQTSGPPRGRGRGGSLPQGLRLQGASSTNIKIFVIASLDVFKEHPNRSSL